MAIPFEPMNEQQAQRASSGCFDPGTFPFGVLDVEAKDSSAGNPMLVVKLKVQTNEGVRQVREYIMLTGAMAWKLRKLCEALGILPQYETGVLDEQEMVGLYGKAEFDIEEGNNGFPDKNRVREYIPATEQRAPSTPTPSSAAPDEVSEDDIPF